MGSRHSNDLDRLLDRVSADGQSEATGDLAPLLHAARVARASLIRSLRPTVAQMQLNALRADRAQNIVLIPSRSRRGFRVAAIGLVAAIVLTMGAGSAIAASAGAIPGDPLYGLKRAVERVSLAMHRDPAGRAALHLQFAEERLEEVEALIAAHKDLSSTLDALDDELNAAESDALTAQALGRDADALLAHVQDMIAKHLTVLNGVLATVPDQAKDAIQRAIDNAGKAAAKVQHGREQNSGEHGRPPTPPAKGKPDSSHH